MAGGHKLKIMAQSFEPLRDDRYSLGLFELLSETTALYDYSQLDYTALIDIYMGLESTQMQYGGLLAQAIVDTLTAFEFAELPTVKVIERATGNEVREMSDFANLFLTDQHPQLLQAVLGKNLFGDVYIAFNLDRNVEAIPPYMVDPGWSPYSNNMDSAVVKAKKTVRSQTGFDKSKATITRWYDLKQIKYEIEVDDKPQGFAAPPNVTLQNPFIGIVPIMHIPNLKRPGYIFGFSDFYSSLPFMTLYHRVLTKGYESQQYHGSPILVISGIEGPVAQWLSDSFGIEVEDLDTEEASSKILQFFKKHKFLALSQAVTASFIESTAPTGKTTEIIKILLGQISRLSAVPEFVFGAEMESGNANVREQYARLRAHIALKRAQFEPYLAKLIKMAMVWYSTFDKNEETGETYENIGLISDWDETNQYTVELIWPEFVGMDVRNKIEAGTLLANAGAVSRQGLGEMFPQYVASPATELERMKDEIAELGPLESPPDSQGSQNADERRRKDDSKTGDNSDGGRTDRRGTNK